MKEWVDKHDGIAGALRWYEAYAPNNDFYQKIAKPLLSIRTTGSIDVERAVKPIKGCILTKQRNSISDGKAVVLFRLAENLKQLHNIKMDLKKSGRKLAAEPRIGTRIPRDAVETRFPRGVLKEEYRVEDIDSSSDES